MEGAIALRLFVYAQFFRKAVPFSGSCLTLFRDTLRAGLDERSFALFVEFKHERLSSSLVLEFPEMVLHTLENERIDGKLDTLANAQRGWGVLGEAEVGL